MEHCKVPLLAPGKEKIRLRIRTLCIKALVKIFCKFKATEIITIHQEYMRRPALSRKLWQYSWTKHHLRKKRLSSIIGAVRLSSHSSLIMRYHRNNEVSSFIGAVRFSSPSLVVKGQLKAFPSYQAQPTKSATSSALDTQYGIAV